jgi:outer membrane protein assembly factor BamB
MGAAACGPQGSLPEDEGASRIRWTFDADAGIYYGSPALSSDEKTVYIGTSNSRFGTFETDHAVYAIQTADGALQWTYALGAHEVRSTPAVGPDGSITFLVQERNPAGDALLRDVAYRLSAGGELLWTVEVNAAPSGVDVGLSAPAIATDGSTYVAGDALYAIAPDGTVKWTALGTGEDLRNSPVVGPDGTVYFAFHNVPLTAFDPDDGSVLWTCDLGVNDYSFASPAIGPNRILYAPSDSGILYAISPAGQVLWQADAAAFGAVFGMRSSPAVGADGTIYLGTADGDTKTPLIAVSGDGTVEWMFEPQNLPEGVEPTHFDIYSSPALGSDGTIYFGHEIGRVYALDPEDGSMQWMVETEAGITWSSPAVAADGTLFVADLSGRLYAIATASKGLLAGAPWPRYRHDNGATGRGM